MSLIMAWKFITASSISCMEWIGATSEALKWKQTLQFLQIFKYFTNEKQFYLN